MGFIGAIIIATNILSVGVANAVDYEKLDKQAMKLNPDKNPSEVINLLLPYAEDPENNDSGFFNTLGAAFSSLKQPGEAIKYQLKSLSLRKDLARPHYNLAISYFDKSNLVEGPEKKEYLKKSLEHFEISAKLDPDRTIVPNLNLWIEFVNKELN